MPLPIMTTRLPMGIHNFVAHMSIPGPANLKQVFSRRFRLAALTTLPESIPGISGTEYSPPVASMSTSGLICSTNALINLFAKIDLRRPAW